MFRYYHKLSGHDSAQTLADSEGQGSLAKSKLGLGLPKLQSMGLQRIRHIIN